MRRWELVSGGSAKFWEIGRDGAAVTVRFGRLQTAGQTQTKELASEDAARAHVAKLVAEKEKKGYRAVGSAAPAAAPQSSEVSSPVEKPAAVLDEDTWVMPKAWLRDAVRQRGFEPAPEFSVDAAKAAEARKQVVEKADVLERAFTTKGSKAELVSAARDHLAGQANPVGAAAIAAITSSGLPSVHAWIADHGVAFAAAAVVEYMGLTFSEQWDVRRDKFTNIRLQPRRGSFQTSVTEQEGRMLTAVRYALAVADDASRKAAETALEDRGATPTLKELRSYLVPSRADWFAEVCKQHYTPSQWWMLPCSASNVEDYDNVKHSLIGSAFILYTAVYVLGPAVAPLLAEELDAEYQVADSRKLVLKVLAALPTDEAFTILLDRLDTKYVHPAVLSAMAAFPVRAARLLAERAAAGDEVRQLLKAHLLSNPDLDVPADVAAVLTEFAVATLPDARADQLPPLLASPPWLNRRPPVKPVVVPDLPVPAPSIVWEAGEREKWLASGSEWYSDERDWRTLLADYQAGTSGYFDSDLFLLAPEEEVRHLLAEWKPSYNYGVEDWGKRIAARFGLDAVPALLRLVQSTPGAAGVVLLPYATVEVATVMAGWFAKTKQPRRWPSTGWP
ncbi:WGR domain-containing protein, partial [Lentzea indica]|uniref:WGR domain-containing protein n=1 Tax=Lentzea indica TaxID=2604800 RepID=UPI0014391A46